MRRDQILDAALTVFARDGYANASVEHVCQAANVSTKSFYRIFENREDLYIALFNMLADDIFQRMYAEIERLPEKENEAQDQLIRVLLHAYFDDPRRAIVMQGTARAVTPTIERMRRESRIEAARYLEGLWRHYGLGGSYTGIAVAAIGGMFDLMTYWLVDGDPDDAGQLDVLAADLIRFYRAVRAGLTAVF